MDLSAAQVRRVGLAAQGFGRHRPSGRIDRRHLWQVLDRVGLLQIDSVNVLVRSHYLPLFSRLGPYPRDLLDRAAYDHRHVFEYWGHEASLIPVDRQPLLRWRMTRAREGEMWPGLKRFARQRATYIGDVLGEVTERGPISAGQLSDPGPKRGPWWGWADGKRALEWLFWTGQVAVATRRNFERVYDLPERVLPADVLAAPTPSEEEAHRQLLLLAGRSLGVGTARDLADYHRIRITMARPRLAELVEDGRLVPVHVEGWREPAYLDPDATVPRRIDARALLSPFDSLVWERARVDRLFDFHLRLELYVPAPKRVYGYYVLPFLLGDMLVGRVDLKADRKRGRLLVPGAFTEPGQDAARVAGPLAEELRSMAEWLELDAVEVGERGDLAPALRRTSRTRATPRNP